MTPDLGFKIPEELVKPILKDIVTKYLLDNLKDPAKVMAELVERTLSIKVNERGVVSTSSYDNKYNYLEIILQPQIREITKEALKELMDSNRDKIKEQIVKAITKNGDLGKFVYDGFMESLKCDWTTKINVTFKE